jgi:hypothetical protein
MTRRSIVALQFENLLTERLADGATIDTVSDTLTVREYLWNAHPDNPSAPLTWGESRTAPLDRRNTPSAGPVTRAGGEGPFRSARPFAAWQDRPAGHGLTMTASVGVCRSPVADCSAAGLVAR